MQEVTTALLLNHKAFVAFARKRLGNKQLAEDAVQDSLLKALKAARHPTTNDEMVTWFYHILRRSIIDVYRRQDVRTRALARLEAELPEAPDQAAANNICQCFKRLLPSLPPSYRELLSRIDLGGERPDDVASALGISRNNVNVRLHRARTRLRQQLVLTCRTCSTHGCLDCTCAG